jgi:hypothetical protein
MQLTSYRGVQLNQIPIQSVTTASGRRIVPPQYNNTLRYERRSSTPLSRSPLKAFRYPMTQHPIHFTWSKMSDDLPN